MVDQLTPFYTSLDLRNQCFQRCASRQAHVDRQHYSDDCDDRVANEFTWFGLQIESNHCKLEVSYQSYRPLIVKFKVIIRSRLIRFNPNDEDSFKV